MSAIYEIAISPDSYEDWPIPLNQMVSWAFEPADEETLRFYIAKGRADAKVGQHRQSLQMRRFTGCNCCVTAQSDIMLIYQFRPEHLCLVTYCCPMQRVDQCRHAGVVVDLRIMH